MIIDANVTTTMHYGERERERKREREREREREKKREGERRVHTNPHRVRFSLARVPLPCF